MRTFHTQFTEKRLTGNAGLVHVGRFVEKLKLKKTIDKKVSIIRAANSDYSVSDAIIMLAMGVIAGAKRISHLSLLQNDHVIRTLFNWDNFPVDTTFSRIFKLFSHKHCKEFSEAEAVSRKQVWSKKWFGKVTLDMDSTVNGVFGSQQGAEKGYNPKKKGQKSYHPLLCFIAENRECLHNWFRSGNTYSANGSVEFMKECIARLPKRVWKVAVRADSAFFSGDLLDFLEGKSCQYHIKVKLKGLESLLSIQKWRKIKYQPGFESTEFYYKCSGWKRKRRFVAVREVIITPSDDPLFPLPKIEYAYFCYVTNMNRSPYASHKYYGKRSTSENWIEWCKNQMASSKILTQDFWANSAIFQSSILAYNLVVWMMWLNDEKGFTQEPNTIRMWLIQVPARLTTSGHSWFLKLSKSYQFKERWELLDDRINRLCFS